MRSLLHVFLSSTLLVASWPLANAFLPAHLPVSRVFQSKLAANTAADSTIAVHPLVASVQPSKTVEVFSLVKQLEAEGEQITSLCVGEPDFPPHPLVLESAVNAINGGETRYTAVTGTAPLRNAISKDLERRKGIHYPATDIVVGNGAKQSVFQSVMATCGPGDAVLIPAPYWPSYPEMARLVGAEPVILETTAESGYHLTPETLKDALENHPNAKMLIMCNPSNPTGAVYTAAQQEALATVLREHPQVAILADEIYERLVYSGDGCPSFAAIPDMFPRTMTINGFSKAHAMTGMRLGYVAAPKHLAQAVSKIQSQLTSCAGSVSQAAAVTALNDVPDADLQQRVDEMKVKRDYVLGELSTMPKVKVSQPPQGAFYVLPEIDAYDGDDTQLCLDLLQKQKLALVPGSSFGAPGTIRISYATSLEELGVAMTKLREFLASLP
eukprot:Nitzschia sp. Nitz4//scaffold10_size219509//152676//154080//NITZ4_001448-RA/size219509-augustus-gene-0.279-mRNA-1//-1//CDS//3329532980//665//frame0